MINRTRIKNSRFDILNDDPKEIKEYIEAEKEKTPEQKEKELKNRKTSIEKVNLQENHDNEDEEPSNNIVVYTRDDNLTHNYFYYFDLYWDAGDCLSSVTLKMPKTDTGNTKYWITYTGEVEVYTGNNINNSVQSTTDKNNTSTPEVYWDLQGLKPIFRGEVGLIKEYEEVLEIHIDSIGKRFKQKIPDEFRQSYINNQNVRDAFQAICEFLGVKYICPPAQPEATDETLQTDSATTDGTENNVTDKTNTEQQAASAVSSQSSQSSQSSEGGENSSENGQNSENQQNTALNTAATTADVPEGPQNGYTDIAFDSSGAITHGSAAIETSPDMAETLIELTEHPLDKYLEDTTYVSTDVKKFLDGEFFETVHGNILDYGSVTITPKTSSSSDMSAMGGVLGATGTNGENSEGSSEEGGGGGSPGDSSGDSSNGWHNGQYYINGKIYLSKEYINSISPAEAVQKRSTGGNVYTPDTLQKLLWRSMGITLS